MVRAHADADIWHLIQGTPWIDADALLEAVRTEAARPGQDYRTRLLLRDSVAALEHFWGKEMTAQRLTQTTIDQVKSLGLADPGEVGFPSIRNRLMQSTSPDHIRRFFHELGSAIRQPARLEIRGSIALMLAGLLRRHTEDIDVVDEVPAAFRGERELLDNLAKRFGLRLAHFQSHYLPDGWMNRLIHRGQYGLLTVTSLDPIDVLLSKLFSKREKDRDDLRMICGQVDRAELLSRLNADAKKLLSEPTLHANALDNWRFMYGTSLPE